MFQLFLRARVHNFLRSQSNNREFKTRLADRDAETDRVRIASIMAAIQTVLDDAEKEKAGLSRRVDDALALAAVTMGAATDEYLERESLNDHQLFETIITELRDEMAAMGDEEAVKSIDMNLDFEARHKTIIECFGRYPYRNEVLQRQSTEEEEKWLADGGERFGT